MSARRKVVTPKLFDYFRLEKNVGSFNNNFYFNTQVFNGFSFITLLVVICLVVGFYQTLFWSLGSSLIVLISFLYLKTQKLSEGITISRAFPKQAREKTEIVITYYVSNETGFGLDGLSFIDEFDGVEGGSVQINFLSSVPAQTQIKITKKVYLGAGMGVKTFQPLKLNLRDELGIFDFKVEFSNIQEVEVYPFLEETPSLKNSISPDSTEYGRYELAKRGDTNLFIGTREYRRGDPVKFINWKLTKKTNKVVVNEFEKCTNTYVTLLLDLNLKNQSGTDDISTWELTKDLALSICHNEIQKNNAVQVISNNMYIPFGTGKNQLLTFEKHFTFHELVNSENQNYFAKVHNLPTRGQIYLICPISFSTDTMATLEALKRLKDEGQQVIVFALDPFQDLVQTVHGKVKRNLLDIHRSVLDHAKRVEMELGKYGISMIFIRATEKDSLNTQLTKNAKRYLEVK